MVMAFEPGPCGFPAWAPMAIGIIMARTSLVIIASPQCGHVFWCLAPSRICPVKKVTRTSSLRPRGQPCRSTSDTNYGTDVDARIFLKDQSYANKSREYYIKFKLDALPASFEKAVFRYYSYQVNDANVHNDLYFVANDNWQENSITWNNKPSSEAKRDTFSPFIKSSEKEADTIVEFDIPS